MSLLLGTSAKAKEMLVKGATDRHEGPLPTITLLSSSLLPSLSLLCVLYFGNLPFYTLFNCPPIDQRPSPVAYFPTRSFDAYGGMLLIVCMNVFVYLCVCVRGVSYVFAIGISLLSSLIIPSTHSASPSSPCRKLDH